MNSLLYSVLTLELFLYTLRLHVYNSQWAEPRSVYLNKIKNYHVSGVSLHPVISATLGVTVAYVNDILIILTAIEAHSER